MLGHARRLSIALAAIVFAFPALAFAYPTFPTFSTAVDGGGYLIGTTTFDGSLYVDGHDPSGSFEQGIYLALQTDYDANYDASGCNTGTQDAGGHIIKWNYAQDNWTSQTISIPFTASSLTVGDYIFWANGTFHRGPCSTWGTVEAVQAHWDGTSFTIIGTSTPSHTEIYSVTPADGATIATSTMATTSVTVWVDPVQWTQDLANNLGPYTVTVQIIPATAAQAAAAPGAIQSLYPKYTYTVNQAGFSTFATTTNASGEGTYLMTTEFTKSQTWYGSILNWVSLGGLGNDNVLDSKNTVFYANKSLLTAIFSASTTEAIAQLLASSTATFASISSQCVPGLSFNIGNCFALVFVPDTAALGGWFTQFRNQFLSYAPWGYANRFIAIITSSATSSSPVIALTFPVGSYGHTTDTNTFTINMDASMQAGSALLNGVHSTWNGHTQNLQDVVEPAVDTIIGITLLLFIGTDILGLFNRERHRPREKLH